MKFNNDQEAIRFIQELKVKDFNSNHLAQFVQIYELDLKRVSKPYSHPYFYQQVCQELMRRLRTSRDEKLIEVVRAVSQYPRAAEMLDAIAIERALISSEGDSHFPQLDQLLMRLRKGYPPTLKLEAPKQNQEVKKNPVPVTVRVKKSRKNNPNAD